MDNNSERLGSLMLFSDIALILSTYGVLFAFNTFVNPVNTNIWIVCTFFLGIKVLILGIADVTGIGKSVLVSLIFVFIADAVIFLMNQLLAFGLSLRMLLFMTVADLIMVLIAVLLWKSYASRRTKSEENWVYETPNEELPVANAATTADEPMDFFEDSTETPQSATEEEDVFNFGSVKLDDEPEAQAPLSFEQITEEIPIEEINRQIEEKPSEEQIIEPTFTTDIPQFESEATVEEAEVVKTQPIEVAPEPVFTTDIKPEQEVAEVQAEPEVTVITPQPEPVIEAAAHEEIVEEIPESEIVQPEEEPVEAEAKVEETEVVEPEVLKPEEEFVEVESKVEEPEQVEAEAVVLEPETVEPEAEEVEEAETKTTGKISVPNFVVEAKPQMMITREDYENIIKSLPKLSTESGIIPLDISAEDLEVRKKTIRQQYFILNDYLNALIKTYNDALEESSSDRIVLFEEPEATGSAGNIDRMIRNKLKMVIDKQFVAEDVIHDLILNTNKVSNQSYSVDVAEENLRERELLEKQRQAEQKRLEEERRLQLEQQEKFNQARRKKEQQALEQRGIRERELKLKQTKEEALKKALKHQREVEEPQEDELAVQDSEVRLKNEGMDIIIDKEDLELLREFLRNQDTNN